MIKRMIGSTSSSSNVQEIVDDNNNPYRNIVVDAMEMNQRYVGQCPILDEEPNADATKFFNHLKDFDELLWDDYINHSKSIIAQVFTIKSDHRLCEVSYDRIVE
jgi:hypothetical protein